jgi:hypothetical protein
VPLQFLDGPTDFDKCPFDSINTRCGTESGILFPHVFLEVDIVSIDVCNLLFDILRVFCRWIIRDMLEDTFKIARKAIKPCSSLCVLFLCPSDLTEGLPNVLDYLNRHNNIPS